MSTEVSKVQREKTDLDANIKRLIHFLGKPTNLDPCQLRLLHVQVHIMVAYSEVLHQRLKLMGDPEHASTQNNQ